MASTAKKSVKSVLVTLGTGTQMKVMAAPVVPGNSVETTSFSAFGDAVKTSTPNGVPQINSFSVTLLDQGETIPLAGDIVEVTVETTYSNNVDAPAVPRKTTGMKCIIQEVSPSTIESDGNHVSTFEVTLLPIGGGDSVDVSDKPTGG